jgi:hypothetical protein
MYMKLMGVFLTLFTVTALAAEESVIFVHGRSGATATPRAVIQPT